MDPEEITNNEETTVEQPTFSVKLSTDEPQVEAPVSQEPEKTVNPEAEAPKPETEQEPDKVPETEPANEITDEAVKEYLKAKGLEFENFEDLKPKEQKKLDAETEKFLEYKEKTGRGYSDFLATQKDWKEESADVAIKQLMKLENPDLTDKEVDFRFNKKFGYDKDLDEEDVIQDKEIEKKVELKKALDFLEKQKEEYMVSKGSLEDSIPEEYKKAKEVLLDFKKQDDENKLVAQKQREEFLSKTDSVFTKDFEGFKTKIGNEEFVIKPEDLTKTKEQQLDIANFQKKFFDNENNLIDAEGYHKSLYGAMNFDKVADHFFNLGKASQAEADEKASKNINMDGTSKVPASSGSGIKVKVVSE